MLDKQLEKLDRKVEQAKATKKKKAQAFLSDVFNYLNENPEIVAYAVRDKVNFYRDTNSFSRGVVVSYIDVDGNKNKKALLSPYKKLCRLFNGTSYNFRNILDISQKMFWRFDRLKIFAEIDSYKKLQSKLNEEGYNLRCDEYRDGCEPLDIGVSVSIYKL